LIHVLIVLMPALHAPASRSDVETTQSFPSTRAFFSLPNNDAITEVRMPATSREIRQVSASPICDDYHGTVTSVMTPPAMTWCGTGRYGAG
jgi:hypothetical protein